MSPINHWHFEWCVWSILAACMWICVCVCVRCVSTFACEQQSTIFVKFHLKQHTTQKERNANNIFSDNCILYGRANKNRGQMQRASFILHQIYLPVPTSNRKWLSHTHTQTHMCQAYHFMFVFCTVLGMVVSSSKIYAQSAHKPCHVDKCTYSISLCRDMRYKMYGHGHSISVNFSLNALSVL